MDLIIFTAFIAMVSGTSTPLPQSPRLFRQVQPPIQPTKASDQAAASITMEGMGPQNPSMDSSPTVESAASDTSTNAKNGEGNSPMSDPSKEQSASGVPNIRITASPVKFGPLNVETADTSVGKQAGKSSIESVGVESSVPANTEHLQRSEKNSNANVKMSVETENRPIDKYVANLNLGGPNLNTASDSSKTVDSGLNLEAAMTAAISDTAAITNKKGNLDTPPTNSAIEIIAGEDAMGEPLGGTDTVTEVQKPNEKPRNSVFSGRTDIKNRANVPTEGELLDSGNIDPSLTPFQVRLEDKLFPTMHKESNEKLNKITKMTPKKTETADRNLPSGAIKNRANVPTALELKEKGLFDPMAQVRMEGPPFIDGPSPHAVKNRNNVPTADELAKSGIDPSDISKMQVRTNVFPFPENAKGKMLVSGDVILPQSLNEKDASIDFVNIGPPDSAQINASTGNENTTNTSSAKPDITTALGNQTEVNNDTRSTTETVFIGMNVNETSENITETTTPVTIIESSSNTSLTNSSDVDVNVTTTTGSQINVTTNTEQDTSMTTTDQPAMTTACSEIACNTTCQHGYKINYKGCKTCKCKYSADCPPVLPVSRLLCLLQVRSSLSCEADADCKANRICCPGTCGAMCRRRSSRRRAVLLSILNGGL